MLDSAWHFPRVWLVWITIRTRKSNQCGFCIYLRDPLRLWLMDGRTALAKSTKIIVSLFLQILPSWHPTFSFFALASHIQPALLTPCVSLLQQQEWGWPQSIVVSEWIEKLDMRFIFWQPLVWFDWARGGRHRRPLCHMDSQTCQTGQCSLNNTSFI